MRTNFVILTGNCLQTFTDLAYYHYRSILYDSGRDFTKQISADHHWAPLPCNREIPDTILALGSRSWPKSAFSQVSERLERQYFIPTVTTMKSTGRLWKQMFLSQSGNHILDSQFCLPDSIFKLMADIISTAGMSSDHGHGPFRSFAWMIERCFIFSIPRSKHSWSFFIYISVKSVFLMICMNCIRKWNTRSSDKIS